MARFLQVQSKVTIQQEATQSGNFYPMCIWANPEFFERFENALILSKSVLEPDTESSKVVTAHLHALSDYKLHKETIKRELPAEIEQHFALLPELSSSIEMEFEPLNNVPTDALLYSFEEVKEITKALLLAISVANNEQKEFIAPFSGAFNSFLISWNDNIEKTGSEFALQEKTE